MTQPIRPSDFPKTSEAVIHYKVIIVINSLIVDNFIGNRAIVHEKDVRKSFEKMFGKWDDTWFKFVCSVYRQRGWNVICDKLANEDSYIIFEWV